MTSSHAFYLVQAVTVARVPLTVAASLLLICAGNSPVTILASAALLLLGEITDLLDGLLARRLKVTSEFGAMLDPYADSVSRLIVFWALAQVGRAYAVTALVMAIRDVTAAYCRIVWAKRGESVKAQLSGKIKAVVQGVAAFALLCLPLYAAATGPWVVDVLSWSVILVTTWSGLDYAWKTVSGPSNPSR